MTSLRMFSDARKNYVLGVLTAVFMLNYIDRGLIILLLQPIKEDLKLSDTQLGFLTGIAFGLFYATLGVPIARWADHGNRVNLTALCIALWGAVVMSCLWVGNLAQLVLARIGAAVGESGCMPPTYSLLGDFFPAPAERTRSMAVYWLGSPLAAMVSFIGGGWLNEHYGWRMTFFLMAMPGLLVAVLVKLTLREPRIGARWARSENPNPTRASEVLANLWHQSSLRHLTIGLTLLFTLALGLAPWYAAFLMRSHGMGTAEVGLWLGLICGIGGITGILLGGYVTARWFSGDERGQMRLVAGVLATLIPCFAAFLLVPHKVGALLALAPLQIAFNFFFGPAFALLQRLVADNVRATTLAIVMLLSNLIGMGIGPQIVGILSDSLIPLFGTDSLRYAMLVISLVAVWAAYHFWRVGSTVQGDLAAVAYRSDPNPVHRFDDRTRYPSGGLS